jgi:hypothetical protein
MSMPGFTAEVALESKKKSYVLAPTDATDAGSLQPQGLYVNSNGDLVYCDSDVGCFVVRHKITHTLM